MSNNVVERIENFNQERNPQRLKLKYKAMRQNAFTFFRGTCHLFYEDLPSDSPLNNAPNSWICGDLHLENFGSYKGDNRLVYFDINDFDEAVLAPCTWDVVRFLTSIIVGAKTLGINQSEVLTLCDCFLNAYTDALTKGKARSVERATSQGMVKDLLTSLKQRQRQDFLNKRTKEKNGKRRFIIDDKKTANITAEERIIIEEFMKNWATTQANPQFFNLLDVAVRIAGTSSLGLSRYVLLIEGKGSPKENYLLDLKQTRSSCLQPYLKVSQPEWKNNAERVTEIQHRMQATAPALLSAVVIDSKSYDLRELQPSEDRVILNQWNGKLRRLENVMITMGKITAWDQLRSGGRQGSAIADEMITWAKDAHHWQKSLLEYAQAYAVQVESDYQEFCTYV